MQKKTMLLMVIVLTAIFLTAQSCSNFALQQQSSDAFGCEYTGQLFCGEDGRTRVCNFINGAPHLEYDGQLCNSETGDLIEQVHEDEGSSGEQQQGAVVPSSNIPLNDNLGDENGNSAFDDSQKADIEAKEALLAAEENNVGQDSNEEQYATAVVTVVNLNACNHFKDGQYCSDEGLITCMNSAEVTEQRVACSDTCVDNNDGNAYCDMQESASPLVMSLNQFCDGQFDGFYCQGTQDDVLVYCTNSAASVYWPCNDAEACASAERMQNPDSC